MASILDVIATETHGSSFKTYKYGFDGIEVPRFDYDDHQYHFTWKRYGETESQKKIVSLKKVVGQIAGGEPLFRYFLDGSRKTYIVSFLKESASLMNGGLRFLALLMTRWKLLNQLSKKYFYGHPGQNR